MKHMADIFPKPYYTVVFISQKDTDDPAFDEMQKRIVAKVASAQGLLGMDRGRTPEGLGFSISYWDSLESIKAWREESTHAEGQRGARDYWYSEYTIRTCQVLDDNCFSREGDQ